MLVLLALAPAHAWLGDDGVYNWSQSDSGDADAPTHVWVDVPNEPDAQMLPQSTYDDFSDFLPATLSTQTYYFYGREYEVTEIQASTNGVIGFGGTYNSYCCSGQPIPGFGAFEPIIAAFWTDLNPGSSGEVWAVDTGTELIVSWEMVGFFGSGGAIKAQVGLRPDGSFRISIDDQQGVGNDIAIGHQRDDLTGNEAFFGPIVGFPVTYLFVPDDVDDDGDGFTDFNDCDDTDPTVNPAVIDTVCDGVVSDCGPPNGEADLDGDGYRGCDGDCNDSNFIVNPGRNEFCDGLDNNCDGNIDEGFEITTWYTDLDFDGWGDEFGSAIDAACAPSGFGEPGDCDDNNFLVNPGRNETCDQLDNDCNGLIDDELPVYTYYIDADLDFWGDELGATVESCGAAPGYGPPGDCDDTNAGISPFELEDCDPSTDTNCDGDTTAGAYDAVAFAFDGDGDGYGVPPVMRSCTPPSTGATNIELDCDDTNASINPGATEVTLDGIDQNCDGYEALDRDGDGISDADEFELGSDWLNEDTDGDGVLDNDELTAGTNLLAADSDGDGVSDADEIGDFANPTDTDDDGVIDALDDDDDGDSWSTLFEGIGDFDEDGVPNYLDTDSDGDGILDADENAESLLRVDEPSDTDDDISEPKCGCSSTDTPLAGLVLLPVLAFVRRRRA
ncbi:MAG: MopE-related protein [Myxococcota bacterium]